MSKSEYFKEKIIEEFLFNIEKINECDNIVDANFYFSAFPAILNRVINFEFDTQLLFIHFILTNAQSTINRLVQIPTPGTNILSIDFFKKLSELLQELMNNIKEKNDIYETLEKIVLLIYTLTGNGRYLKEKGIITI